MAQDKPSPELSTAAPLRNFTISAHERIAALVAGPPPYARRLRRIEDLTAKIIRDLAQHEAWASQADEVDAQANERTLRAIRRDLDRLNALIDDHNRYYPIEKRLPIDLRTRQLIDWGEPWVPMAKVELETLVEAARRR